LYVRKGRGSRSGSGEGGRGRGRGRGRVGVEREGEGEWRVESGEWRVESEREREKEKEKKRREKGICKASYVTRLGCEPGRPELRMMSGNQITKMSTIKSSTPVLHFSFLGCFDPFGRPDIYISLKNSK
jgi:hypothetical protein